MGLRIMAPVRRLYAWALRVVQRLGTTARRVIGRGPRDARRRRIDWGALTRTSRSERAGLGAYYVAAFLDAHRADLVGDVLELTNPSGAAELPEDHFDCVVMTRGFNVAADVRFTLTQALRTLRSGGVLLCAASSLASSGADDGDEGGWRVTPAGLRVLLRASFPLGSFDVGSSGTLMACAAELNGLAPADLAADDRDTPDPRFPVVVTARAVKPPAQRPAHMGGGGPVLPQPGRGRPFEWGDLRRREPFSAVWGFDRGTPVDRIFIERFIEGHRDDIRGHVLEVHDPFYATRFRERVVRTDVVDIDPGNRQATITADLTRAEDIASDRFDCFILTHTLQYIDDVMAALRHAERILRPGGVLLCSVPAVSRVAPEYADGDGDYWRFTEGLVRRLFGDVFGADRCRVVAYGNRLVSTAFLYGLAAEEVPSKFFETSDARCPLIVCARAQKTPQ